MLFEAVDELAELFFCDVLGDGREADEIDETHGQRRLLPDLLRIGQLAPERSA